MVALGSGFCLKLETSYQFLFPWWGSLSNDLWQELRDTVPSLRTSKDAAFSDCPIAIITCLSCFFLSLEMLTVLFPNISAPGISLCHICPFFLQYNHVSQRHVLEFSILYASSSFFRHCLISEEVYGGEKSVQIPELNLQKFQSLLLH